MSDYDFPLSNVMNPHKNDLHYKKATNVSSRNIDFSRAELANSVDKELIAQGDDRDLGIKDTFKADQDEKGELTSDSIEGQEKIIYMLCRINEDDLKCFVPGETINFIDDGYGSVIVEGNGLEENSRSYLNIPYINGFSSANGFDLFIELVNGIESKEEALEFLENMYKARSVLYPDKQYYNDISEIKKEKNLELLNSAVNWVIGRPNCILKLPLNFGRINKINKYKLTNEIELVSFSMKENNIKRFPLLITDSTVKKIAFNNFDLLKNKGKYLVDEKLQDQYDGIKPVEESVYPDIENSIIL